MVLIQQLLFLIVTLVALYIFIKRVLRIRKNILLGQDENRRDQSGKRWRSMLLVAFGQKKMFKKPIPAFLHLLIYVGFLVINLEMIEFILDGVTGNHRIFAGFLEGLGFTGYYTTIVNIFEFMVMAVLVSCLFFLVRRNALKVKRFRGLEMTKWPSLDANLILIFEILLMCAILTMNATDQILQGRNVIGYPDTGTMVFSQYITFIFHSMSTQYIIIVERIAWWFHIIGIFSFAIYITYSKHLHTFMAFPNTFYANLKPLGKIDNMPEVTREVNSMLGINTPENQETPIEIKRFGAKDVRDLSWKSLMDAYTCTECGRCTAECPANQTGKKLSPRKIMMDTRDRLEEVGSLIEKQGKEAEDGKSLLGDYITKEEIFACTSCNACVEACPILINPLAIILQMRRYMSMEESSAPSDWNAMFSNIETSFAPWKFPPSERFNWVNDLNKK